MLRVRFFKQYSSFFPGESAWLPANIVEQLVIDRKAKRYTEGESLEDWPETEAKSLPTESSEISEVGESVQSDKFDPAKDPFMLDGLDLPTSTALHAAGLHTPGDVEKYIGEGKLLTDLDNIADGRAKKINELYGVK